MDMVHRSAGIMLSSKVTGLLGFFALPKIVYILNFDFRDQNYSIFLIEYPILNERKNSKKRLMCLRKLLSENRIELIMSKDKILCDELHLKKNEFLEEAVAFKKYAAVRKLCEQTSRKLTRGSFGFLVAQYNLKLLDVISDDASNVMLYEAKELDKKTKNKIFSEFMEKKGISIVFSGDAQKVIESSDILIVDDKLDLSSYEHQLENKTIISEKAALGSAESITDIFMWFDGKCGNEQKAVIEQYNDELIAIIRFFNKDLHYCDFVSCFPIVDYRVE
ncbi:MAG: hypothetical protein ACOZCL_19100 [Bacillota bacterium]